MARTAITPQVATPAGLTPAFEPANVDGNSFVLRQARALRIKNGSGVSINVTLPTPGTVDGLAIADRVVAVPAGADMLIGLSRGDAYRQTDGSVYVDYSAVASVTVAVLDIP
ncbi:hypothetical protein [Blastococcus sp. TF02A-26]|uniref:hypothetical protein n=1 Tax=Blastococcus sp. TF02A-26 TaxID=2250577 RepID=UPI000DEBB766|nr:hypothetical protein [Blastococcus sp. TF02A-26]RBY82681.1 hypothetical protein DQ240_18480 [Blastococcus sp. TF02A-26]